MNRTARWICLMLAAGLTGCAEEPAPVDPGPRPVRLFTVGSADAAMVREYPGTVAAAREVQMGFEVPGKLIEFPVKEGAPIKAGDLIGRLDPTSFRATVEAAKAQVAAAKADVERKRELVKIGGVARVAVEEAERRYTAARSDLETAEKGLADAALRAPFDGVVAKKISKQFANVQAKEPVITIQDPSWLEISVQVPEVDAVLAKPGLSLAERNQRTKPTVVVSALPDKPLPAQITEFSPTADPVTRTYELTLVFARVEGFSILPGMSAHVTITPAHEKGAAGVRVPARAVVGDADGAPFVWVIDDQMQARKRPVAVGRIDGSMIRVNEGLAAGERIAATGVHAIQENLTVRSWEAK